MLFGFLHTATWSQSCSTPPYPGSVSGCAGTYTLMATTTYSGVTAHRWYTSQTGSTMVTPTNQYSPSTNIWISQLQASYGSTVTYWVAARCGSSESSRTPVTFTLTAASNISISPSGNPFTACEGIFTLTATGGTNYSWYLGDPDNGGTFLSSTTVYSPSQSGNYYLKGTNSCGVVQTTLMPVTIVTPPGGPVATDIVIKYNTAATLTAGGAVSGETYKWYEGDMAPLGQGLTYTTSYTLTENRSYHVSRYLGCESIKVPFTVIVNKIPVADAGPDQTVGLPKSSFSLYGSGSDPDYDGLSYQWTKVSGPSVTLNGAATPMLTLTNLVAGVYTFQLKVTDPPGDFATDNVVLTVSDITNNYSYQREDIVRTGNILDKSQIASLGASDRTTNIIYFNDLGLPMEMVAKEQSPLGKDIMTPRVYDDLGRETKMYLPVVFNQTNGNYQSLLDNGEYAGTVAGFYTDKPYAVTVLENSGLSRPLKQGSTGAAWQPDQATGHSEFSYGTNTSASPIRKWTITGSLPTSSAAWVNAQLKVETVTDIVDVSKQSVNQIISNFEGVKLVERSLAEGTTVWAEKHHVYDSRNNLRFIIPPALFKILKDAANYNPTQAQVDKWCYQFKYDELNRTIESKGPGTDWVYTIYDKRGRVVLTQDGNQRLLNDWSYTKYDEFDRPVISGIYKPSTVSSRSQMQAFVNGLDNGAGYQNTTPPANTTESMRTGTDIVSAAYDGYSEYQATNSIVLQPGFSFSAATQGTFVASIGNGGSPASSGFPTENAEALVITYYDNYNGSAELFLDPSFQFVSETWQTATGYDPFLKFNRIRGQITGMSVRVLNTNQWLHTVTYYDQKQRPLQILSSVHTGGVSRFSTLYDFSGKVLESKLSELAQVIAKRFTYDAVGRPLKVYHKLNNQPEVILSSVSYDEKGNVKEKNLHSADNGATYLQSVDYTYNIKGWTTKMNSASSDESENDYFGMEMAYASDDFSAGASLRKDGMITALKWRKDFGTKQRLYNFDYDGLNRMTDANYKAGANGAWSNDNDFYSEKNITYDLNGNIQTLKRKQKISAAASAWIDDLSYNYGASPGNQLIRVTENSTATEKDSGFKDGNVSTDDYVYDVSGNLTYDKNKDITIEYNDLNLPKKVTFTDDTYTLYSYDAGGTKLSQASYSATDQLILKTDYVGGQILINDEPSIIFHEEGRLLPPSYSNLIENREANGLSGFTAKNNVTLTSEYLNGETYVKVVSNQTGTPGVWPIGEIFTAPRIKSGETYTFKVLGYQSVGTTANIYVVTNHGALVWPGQALPQGSANENWISATFTLPANTTTLRVGVIFQGAAAGHTFYINRVALYKTDWEYQYFLKDQVGSPRVVLSTDPSKLSYTATFETENHATETTQFLNIDYTKVVTLPAAANATPGGNESISMNNTYRIGPARSLKVYPGDKIDASVNAYYPSVSSMTKTATTTMAAALIAVMTGGTVPVVDGGITAAYQNSAGGQTGFLLSPDQGSNRPSAFLNYILFDENYVPLEAKSVPVGSTAASRHLIALTQVVVKEAGIMFIYLSYDNASPNMVYFDDLKITHTESHVVQVNDYYPFGMTSYSWIREGEYENRFLYQSKELDSKTGWQDFHARQYDPALGRWFAIDPAGQFSSPYNAMGNSPVMFADHDGKWVHLVIGALVSGISNYIAGSQAGLKGSELFNFVVGGTIIGALTGGVGSTVTSGVGSTVAGASGGIIGAATGGAAAGALNGFYSTALANSVGISDANPLAGAWKGGVSGLVGATSGAYISGDVGAFLGGSLGAATNAGLNGGTLRDVGLAAAFGGTISFGSYWGTMWVSHAESDGHYNWKQFRKLAQATQRSFARGREDGGWITKDDVILNPRMGSKNTIKGDNWAPMPKDAIARFHTHPNIGTGWTETFSASYDSRGKLAGGDLYNIDVMGRLSKSVNEQTYLRLQHIVIGRQNSYQVSTWSVMNGGKPSPASYNYYYRYPYYSIYR